MKRSVRRSASKSTPEVLTEDERARVRAVTAPLRRWYAKRHRDLPWRENTDPYRVWISEIMLQQTQVKTVIPYYTRFMERFPTIEALATAEEDVVLEYWAGLGYYSRGRNLRRAAATMVSEHRGSVPDTNEDLRALPGVGEYTAAAIGSIAFDHAVPVIDGNVERVIARYLTLPGDPKRAPSVKKLRAAAALAVPTKNPGDHNQAMMELGATVCTPRNPNCPDCPVAAGCSAREQGDPHAYPPPRKRRATETQYWIAPVVRGRRGVWLRRNPGDAPFLRGQWGLSLLRHDGQWPTALDPLIASTRSHAEDEVGVITSQARAASEVRHSITFRRLHVLPIIVTTTGPTPSASESCRWIAPHDIDSLPALYRKILADVFVDH